jgi:hypothetical protein
MHVTDQVKLLSMRTTILLGAATLLMVSPAVAHHSFAADFDDKKPVTIDGTVVKFEFMNPHSWIHINVKDPDGKVVRWSVETGSTNALFRRGWRKDSLREGDHVTIDAFRAKDGSNTANANSVKLPDGRQLSAGSSRETTAK